MKEIIVADDLVRLLICIATMRRGHTDEQIIFLNRMEKYYFTEKENLE